MQLNFNLTIVFLCFLFLISCNSDKNRLIELTGSIPIPPYTQLDKATQEVIKRSYDSILSQAKNNNSKSLLSFEVAKLAKLYFVNKLYTQSLETFNVAIIIQSGQFSWHYIAGVAAQRTGNFDEAIKKFVLAISIKPIHIPTRLHLAEIYALQNKPVLKSIQIKKILEIENNNSIALFMKAQMLLDEENFVEALSILEELVVRYPKANKLYYSIASALRMQNKPKLASASLLKAGSQSLNYKDLILENLQKLITGAGSHLALANRAKNSGNLIVARSHLLSALKYEPDNINALHNLGFIAGVTKNHNDAIKYLEKALTLDHKNVDIASDYATALVSVKRYKDAIKVYNNILILNPTDKLVNERLKQLNDFIITKSH